MPGGAAGARVWATMRWTRPGVRIALALLTATGLSSTGCVWLAIGGAGAAGYEIAKDDRSISTKFDDASITTAIKTRLLTDERINVLDVNVDTYEGVVTLHGHVETRSDRGRAIEIASGVKGVRSVTSELRALPPSD